MNLGQIDLIQVFGETTNLQKSEKSSSLPIPSISPRRRRSFLLTFSQFLSLISILDQSCQRSPINRPHRRQAHAAAIHSRIARPRRLRRGEPFSTAPGYDPLRSPPLPLLKCLLGVQFGSEVHLAAGKPIPLIPTEEFLKFDVPLKEKQFDWSDIAAIDVFAHCNFIFGKLFLN